jgi:hypothetical protein
MESAPVHEMTPEFFGNGNPEDLNSNVHVFSKEGEYYLAYTASENQEIEISLNGGSEYLMEVIDTWNMEIIEQKTVKSGQIRYTTELPYCALRFTVN